MTRLRTLIVAIAGSGVIMSAPMLATPASAQTTAASSVLPVILWGMTGAMIGAIAWPIVAGGAAASAVPGGMLSLATYYNTGAAAGAVIGGGGYLLAR